MTLPDVSEITNGWQALATIASVAVIVLGYLAMQRAKAGADKQTEATQEVANRVAEVPRLLETVELLTAQAKEDRKVLMELKGELTDYRDYVAELEAHPEFTDPPFKSLAKFRAERQKRAGGES